MADIARAEIRHVDIGRVDATRGDPAKVGRLLRSLARNVATCVAATTLAADAGGADGALKDDTVRDHLQALDRLMIIEDQPAWAPHLRSKSVLRSAPKRHFVGPSLPVAALRATPDRLLGLHGSTRNQRTSERLPSRPSPSSRRRAALAGSCAWRNEGDIVPAPRTPHPAPRTHTNRTHRPMKRLSVILLASSLVASCIGRDEPSPHGQSPPRGPSPAEQPAAGNAPAAGQSPVGAPSADAGTEPIRVPMADPAAETPAGPVTGSPSAPASAPAADLYTSEVVIFVGPDSTRTQRLEQEMGADCYVPADDENCYRA